MKKSIVTMFALVALMCVSIASCGKSGSDAEKTEQKPATDNPLIVGYWEDEEGTMGEFTEGGETFSISEAGKGNICVKYIEKANYTLEGNKLTFKAGDQSNTADVKSLTEKELVYAFDDKTFTMHRISEDKYKAEAKGAFEDYESAKKYLEGRD